MGVAGTDLSARGCGVDEEELGRRFARGEERAFEEVARLHGEQVARLARRLMGGRDGEAEDAVQEVFVRAYEKRRGFRGASSVRTWLMRITVNTCRSMQRRRIV